MPLWTRLKNGQSVEIITAEGQTPQATWLDIATTGKAKTAIRRSLREANKGRFAKLGLELARAAFENLGKKATDKALEKAARTLRLADAETLLARLGSAEITAGEVVEAVYPNLAIREEPNIEARRAVVGLAHGQGFERAPAVSRCRANASSG